MPLQGKARQGKATQGKLVRVALSLTLLAAALATRPVSADDPSIPSYMELEEGILSPIEVDSPSDEEPPEEGDDEGELKPPDWCEVTPRLLPGATADTSALPDLGGFGTMSASSSSSGDPTGTATEKAAVSPQGSGIGETGFCPPDPTVAAGPNHLMLAVNASIASYSETPAKQWTSTFKSWLGPRIRSLVAPSDVDAAELFFYHPSLVYDQLAERFVFSLAAVDALPYLNGDTLRSGASSILIFGVSKTSNPNGGWCVYAVPASGYSHDPRIGYDDDFLFLTNNEYTAGDGPRVQAGLYVIPKAPIMTSACSEASFRAFLGLLNPGPTPTLAMFVYPSLPADPQATPLGESEPYYLVSARSPAGLVGGAEPSDKLILWKVTNGLEVAPVEVDLPDEYYRPSPTGGVEETCAPGGRRWLDAYDSRIRNAVYSGDRVWASQVVSRDRTSGANLTRLRVYGIDPELAFGPNPNHPDLVLRRDLVPPAGGSLFNPGVMTTTGGDMAIGFNSNVGFVEVGETFVAKLHPSIWTARWLDGGWQSGVQVKHSEDCYEHSTVDGPPTGSGFTGRFASSPYRWGETTGASPDPDGSGIWFYGVYAASRPEWATWLAKVTF